MDDKELKQLAIDIVEQKVFGTFHMNKCEIAHLSSVFMPLLFIDKKQSEKLTAKKIVHLYEYYSEALPVGVNGMPCFMSMRNIVQKDWQKIVRYIAEYKIKVKSFLDKKDPIKESEGLTLFDVEKK